MALRFTSQQRQELWVRRSRRPGFTLKYHDRRNQARQNGGTITKKIYVESTVQTYGWKEVRMLIQTLHQQEFASILYVNKGQWQADALAPNMTLLIGRPSLSGSLYTQ